MIQNIHKILKRKHFFLCNMSCAAHQFDIITKHDQNLREKSTSVARHDNLKKMKLQETGSCFLLSIPVKRKLESAFAECGVKRTIMFREEQ